MFYFVLGGGIEPGEMSITGRVLLLFLGDMAWLRLSFLMISSMVV